MIPALWTSDIESICTVQSNSQVQQDGSVGSTEYTVSYSAVLYVYSTSQKKKTSASTSVPNRYCSAKPDRADTRSELAAANDQARAEAEHAVPCPRSPQSPPASLHRDLHRPLARAPPRASFPPYAPAIAMYIVQSLSFSSLQLSPCPSHFDSCL